MVTSSSGPLACAALAAVLLCLPRPAAPARIAGLWPSGAPPRPSRRPSGAGWTVLAGVGVGLVAAGPGGGLAGLLVAVTAYRRRAATRSAAAAAATASELASAVARMADELASGMHPAAALAGTVADGPRARDVLGPAAAAGRLGDDVPHALRRGADRRPEVRADVARLADAWALADRHGIPLAELLAGVRADLRWRLQFAGRVRAELAGPRATALVLTTLPLLGVALGQLVGADPLAVLRDGPLGQVLLVVGVALGTAGVAWSEAIMQSAVPR
ncbi:type II secretion system F family protein [Pseudonocardia sp.]|uniref:type II secretion system F family protein n=1 Tax=Pseudonocardia sp. TaxID=60912 RepID=UPI0026312F1A|nr:type II secretion system F family protein [Pseudonocardia sp.]